MTGTLGELFFQKKNFIFLGETGSGKSEAALNFAACLAAEKKRAHIFDMDQTKPLFRSRDLRETMGRLGVAVHFSEQLLDAPTLVSGVAECLADPDRCALLDIGGGETAARMAGGFARLINKADTAAIYVVNPYRPWSKNILSVDQTMSYIMRATRVERVYVLGNPNLGPDMTAAEFWDGCEQLGEMLEGHTSLIGVCVSEELFEDVNATRNNAAIALFPLHLYLTYPWADGRF